MCGYSEGGGLQKKKTRSDGVSQARHPTVCARARTCMRSCVRVHVHSTALVEYVLYARHCSIMSDTRQRSLRTWC